MLKKRAMKMAKNSAKEQNAMSAASVFKAIDMY